MARLRETAPAPKPASLDDFPIVRQARDQVAKVEQQFAAEQAELHRLGAFEPLDADDRAAKLLDGQEWQPTPRSKEQEEKWQAAKDRCTVLQAAVELARKRVEEAKQQAARDFCRDALPEHQAKISAIVDTLRALRDAVKNNDAFIANARQTVAGEVLLPLSPIQLDPRFWTRVEYVANEFPGMVADYLAKEAQ